MEERAERPGTQGAGTFLSSADFYMDVFVEFIESVLEAGERGEVWGTHIGEVRARPVAFDEPKSA
jgi:hypothetical protein